VLRLVCVDYSPSQRFNALLWHQWFGRKPVGFGFVSVPVEVAAIHRALGVDKFVAVGGAVHAEVRYFVSQGESAPWTIGIFRRVIQTSAGPS
jgi:hypothetical protein